MPRKARVTAPEPTAEPESLHSHSNFLLHDIPLVTGRHFYLFVYNQATACQSNVFVPIVTVPEKHLYVMRNIQRYNPDKV